MKKDDNSQDGREISFLLLVLEDFIYSIYQDLLTQIEKRGIVLVSQSKKDLFSNDAMFNPRHAKSQISEIPKLFGFAMKNKTGRTIYIDIATSARTMGEKQSTIRIFFEKNGKPPITISSKALLAGLLDTKEGVDVMASFFSKRQLSREDIANMVNQLESVKIPQLKKISG